MSQLAKGFLEVLKPAYYVPESNQQLQADIQEIFIVQDASNNRYLPVAIQAAHTIALAIFISTPYFFYKGSVNFFLNCVLLNTDRMILEHYKAGMQSLIYSVIATIYIAIGIFKPSVFMSFAPRSPGEPNHAKASLELNSPNESAITREEVNEGLLNPKLPLSNNTFRSLSNQSLEDYIVIDSENNSMNSWEMLQPNGDELADIKNSHILRKCGIVLELQDFRIALDECIRVLHDDFAINLHDKLTKIQKWLKTPNFQNDLMIKALEKTLVYLLQPVDPWACEGFCYTNAKEQREVYIKSLRETIATEQYKKIQKNTEITEEYKECRTLIRSLCAAIFLCEKHDFLRRLLQLHEEEYDLLHPGLEEIPAVTRENFAEVVMAKNAKVNRSPDEIKVSKLDQKRRMFYGAVGIEDFLMTDLPFLRGKQVFINEAGEERIFYYMRHPTPHVPNSITGTVLRIVSQGYIESGETIAPEFEGMLEAIAERGESYLIQSHQRLNDRGIIENEDGRSQTLYRLQESQSNFHVVFQAVEGDLFERRGIYSTMTTFTELKKAVKDSFYDEESPNRLPYLLEGDEYYRDVVIGDLLNQVHQKIFGNRINISFGGVDLTQPDKSYSNREWQEFILAFYIFQGDDLKFRLPNVKYFSTNCKNFFDRGGNRAMAEDRMHQEMSRREVTREQLEEIIVNLIPVPLQSKGKGVIEHRLRPGLALVDTLAKLPLIDKQSLQEVSFSGYKPDRFEIGKHSEQARSVM